MKERRDSAGGNNRLEGGDILSSRVVTMPKPATVSPDSTSPSYRGRVSANAALVNYDSETELRTTIGRVCPTGAISAEVVSRSAGGIAARFSVDERSCISCAMCQRTYPQVFTVHSEFALARAAGDAALVPGDFGLAEEDRQHYEELGMKTRELIGKRFGKSLAIREVDAGSCNGCEVEVAALNNPLYDIERFGIRFVASPRHADILLVTGPASRNMQLALERTYKATPGPKAVVAVGACAFRGGIFGDTYATTGGIDGVVPVDVYVPGCPPRPQAMLYGILLAVGRLR